MRWAWVVLTVAACNDVFGLEPTRLRGMPTSCPPLGTPPRYAPLFVQMLVADCSDYTPSAGAGIALAACAGSTGRYIAGGPVGGELAAVDVPPQNNCVNLDYARLVPEGDRAYVDENNFDCNGNDTFGEYVPVDASHWTYVRDLGIAPSIDGSGEELGSVSTAPGRRAMITINYDSSLHEWVQQPDDTWRELTPAYTSGDLGIAASGLLSAANLTSDGLRVVFAARVPGTVEQRVFYADRASRDDRFGAATPLDGVPGTVDDPVMTDDCTRVYFSGLGRIFYVEETE
ncbi:MAG: hypothetical protein ACM31C_04095 [Acidobacteriota bacterium]